MKRPAGLRSLRPLLRFNLRSLLVFIFIVAALCAWLGQHVVRASRQRPIVARIVAAGGSVAYDYQIDLEFNRMDRSRPPPGSQLVRSVFGDDLYATVILVRLRDPTTSDAEVAHLRHQMRQGFMGRVPGFAQVPQIG